MTAAVCRDKRKQRNGVRANSSGQWIQKFRHRTCSLSSSSFKLWKHCCSSTLQSRSSSIIKKNKPPSRPFFSKLLALRTQCMSPALNKEKSVFRFCAFLGWEESKWLKIKYVLGFFPPPPPLKKKKKKKKKRIINFHYPQTNENVCRVL